ncbi:MAG: hypothetical protein ACRDJC_00670, partial [Thermomicrobiales bacterium]
MTDARNVRAEADEDLAEQPEFESGDGLDLETVAAERDRYFDQLQRTAADYANYRRRTEQERAQQRLLANEQL